MLQLLQAYGIQGIIVFVFMLAVAIKQLIELISYFKKKRDESYQTDHKDQQQDETIAKVVKLVGKLTTEMDLLIQSDKDSIKSWIVERYNHFKRHPEELDQMQWDLLNKRYQHYKDEGGNSYIEDVMAKLKDIYKKRGQTN